MGSGDSASEFKVHMPGIRRHGMALLLKCSGWDCSDLTAHIPSLSRFSLPALCSRVERALSSSRLSPCCREYGEGALPFSRVFLCFFSSLVLSFTCTLRPLLPLATKWTCRFSFGCLKAINKASREGARNRRKVHLAEIADNHSVVFQLMVFECGIGARRRWNLRSDRVLQVINYIFHTQRKSRWKDWNLAVLMKGSMGSCRVVDWVLGFTGLWSGFGTSSAVELEEARKRN